MVQPDQACWKVTGEDDKLGRLPGLNPTRAERSNFCIFAYVEKQAKEKGGRPVKIGNISNIENYPTAHVASLDEVDEFVRENAKMELDLLPGESRGY